MTEYNQFLDSWNSVLGLVTPAHHHRMTNFLTDVLEGENHRGLLMAFRHSGKSTIVGIFATCVLFLRPQTRILILSAQTHQAARMVMHIRNILENHPWCQDMIPKNLNENIAAHKQIFQQQYKQSHINSSNTRKAYHPTKFPIK